MPTFDDPHADAREAAEAVRGLAHATQRVEDPDVLYPVIGELMAATRSLGQVLDQLGRAHQQHTARAATNTGSREEGSQFSFEAAAALHEAAAYVGRADSVLDRALNRSGRIAWQPEHAPHRWVSVVFLQGEEADPVMEIIDRQGTDAAIAYLAGWDQGDDTISDAMENGYVYDTAPQTPADRLATSGDYALTYSPDLNYVGLSRRIDAPNPDLDAPASITETTHQRPGRHRGTARSEGASWFLPDAIAEVAVNRGLTR